MGLSGRREVPGACPLDCPDTCAWTVTVEDGVAVKLRGRRDHPVTNGGLCRKMNGFLGYASRPDRLRRPMRRIGPKGAPGPEQFVPIGWDEAIERWASKWREILDRAGGDAIWPFAGTGTLGLIQGIEAGQRLFNTLGLANHHASICSTAGYAGLDLAMGTPATFDPEELVDAGVILVWGANPVVAHSHAMPVLDQARARGAHVVCIDPIRTASAARSDTHLAIRPGTDGALALGLMAELVRTGHVDDEFLAARTLGWDEFRSTLSSWSAARAADVCGVDPAEVDAVADLIRRRSPLAIELGVGFQRHAGGGQAARVIACLPAVTGDHDRPAGGLCYSTSHHYGFDRAALHRPDLRRGAARTLVMTQLGATLQQADPPVESLLVFAANPVVSNPDQTAVRRGLARPDLFTVVIEHVHTPTADYADLLLPSTTQLEHLELLRSYGHLYVHWNEPAVEPPGDCLPHTEIFRRLARALGVTEPAVYATDLELAASAIGDDPSMHGIEIDELRRSGVARLAYDRPFAPHASAFPTPSGRFEFVSERAATWGQGRLPFYAPPAEAADDPGDGTLALLAPAGSAQLNSMFGDRAQPPLALHPVDAARLGVVDGDEVEVANARGSFRITVVVSDAPRPGVAVTAKGYWPSDGSPSVNATVAERDSDMGAGAVFHDNRVSIRRV